MVMGRNTPIVVLDEDGTERAVHRLPYGTHLRVDDGDKVKRGDRLAEWDPYTRPILTEIDGMVDFEDLVEGVSVSERRDESTGITNRVIIDWRATPRGARSAAGDGDQGQEGQDRQAVAAAARPAICLPVDAILSVEPGHQVKAGDVLARIPIGERQDARHHRRSAAGGRAVRGAPSEGPRHHRRDLGHGAAWPRLQEQAAHHHRRRTRTAPSRSSI